MPDHVNAHKHFHVHPVVAGQIIVEGLCHGMRALRVPAEPRSVLAQIEGVRAGADHLLIQPWVVMLRERARRARLIVPDAVFGLAWSGAMLASDGHPSSGNNSARRFRGERCPRRRPHAHHPIGSSSYYRQRGQAQCC